MVTLKTGVFLWQPTISFRKYPPKVYKAIRPTLACSSTKNRLNNIPINHLKNESMRQRSWIRNCSFNRNYGQVHEVSFFTATLPAVKSLLARESHSPNAIINSKMRQAFWIVVFYNMKQTETPQYTLHCWIICGPQTNITCLGREQVVSWRKCRAALQKRKNSWVRL